MIRCKCIDDSNKPDNWYENIDWIKEGEYYHVTNVHEMMNQGHIMGYSLAEIPLPANGYYVCFKAQRFAINPKDLEKLMELIKESSELSGVDVNELTEQLNLETV